MAAPDQELKKAFGELQMKMIESKQKIKLNDIQVQGYIYVYIQGNSISFRPTHIACNFHSGDSVI